MVGLKLACIGLNYRRALQSSCPNPGAPIARLSGKQTPIPHLAGVTVSVELKTYEDFAQRIPFNDYDDLNPWIERIQRGEKRVLTADRVRIWFLPAVQPGARKLIPFTRSLQREFNRAIGPWIADLYGRHPSSPSAQRIGQYPRQLNSKIRKHRLCLSVLTMIRPISVARESSSWTRSWLCRAKSDWFRTWNNFGTSHCCACSDTGPAFNFGLASDLLIAALGCIAWFLGRFIERH